MVKVKYDRERNTVIVEFEGNVDAEQAKQFFADLEKVRPKPERDFTLLTDASEMRTHPQDIKNLHEEAQTILVKSGVVKIAEIVKDDIAEIQLNAMAKKTHLPKRNFKSLNDAEEWLNEKIE